MIIVSIKYLVKILINIMKIQLTIAHNWFLYETSFISNKKSKCLRKDMFINDKLDEENVKEHFNFTERIQKAMGNLI